MKKEDRIYITDIEDLRRIELGALDAFVEYCRAHNLTYYLSGGTLLGAVRHQGFIPWDDDIDIVMPRPDYKKLLEISGGVLSKDHRIVSFEKDANCCRLYYRVVDIHTGYQDKYYSKKYESSMGIDVFPIDGVPENEEERRKYFEEIKSLRQKFIYSVSAPFKGTSLVKAILKTFIMLPYKIMGAQHYYKKINDLVLKYPFDASDIVALTVGYYNSKEVLKKQQYGTPIPLMFEGKMYSAPADYKQYLENLYGDYMKLPNKEQQVSHHAFTVWKR